MMNVSYLNTQGINDAGNLCQDPETKGFDLQAGQSWIYPTNYPVRDYQFSIIQEALYKNTLVSLPTGLGKTFIAAVVMYNFYRWYPHDKIIFMAPTRPLVKQQMDACYNIMAIPSEVTAELTGTKVQQSRTEIWQNKRVFFITPQVLQNDLSIIIELASKIKCLVFDEAHRAKGNHAYCEVVRKLLPKNKLFRVLALSATPGNSSKDVIDVMQNLLIAHVEFRSEESEDVRPYVFERVLETVVVPLGEKLQQIKDEYIQILEKYTRTLIKYKVIYGNCGNLTKGKIFMVMKEFQAKNSGSRTPNYGEIMKSLNICVTLYHAYETLVRCGLRAFLNFYEEHINNPLLSGNMSLRQILEDLRKYLGPNPEVEALPDGSFIEIPSSTKFGHPKFYKLRDILITHFKNCDTSTRIIVFFEYRESATEAYALLSQSYPMIKARVFVGQGSGVTQRDQINTVKAFREGTCNTLLSTCIGEEGLDVGEVDLIVCFDIANKSPIRMIQRMGRTGRKKEGRVVVLVTEGREQQTLKDCLIYKNNLGNFVSNSEQLEAGKYLDNPKMVPSYVKPKCQKMFITVKKQPVSKKNNNLKDMLKKISSKGPKFSDHLEIVEIQERIKIKIENLWDKNEPLQFKFEPSKIDYTKHIEKQRAFQDCGDVKHSKQTNILVSLLQFADSKRYNLPVTQQISKINNIAESRVLKQGDIRNMFIKPASVTLSQENLPLNTQLYDVVKEKDITQSFPPELFDEISAYLSITTSINETCKTCDFLFECPKLDYYEFEKIDLSTWVQPDLSIVDNITAKDLQVFADSLSPQSKKIYSQLELDEQIFDDAAMKEFSEEFQEDHQDKSLAYEAPRNFDKILDSFRICEEIEEIKIVEEKSFAYETPKSFKKVLDLMAMDENKNEEITARSVTSRKLEAISEEHGSYFNESKDWTEILLFFKLSSLEDLFDTSKNNLSADLDATLIYTSIELHESPRNNPPGIIEESPDLFPSSGENGVTRVAIEEPGSPILCTYERMQTLQAKKKLFNESRNEEVVKKPKLSNLKLNRKSFYESSRSKTPKKSELKISDVCDLDSFVVQEKEEKKNEYMKVTVDDDLDIRDVCDLSIFGLGETCNTQKRKENENVQKQTFQEIITNELVQQIKKGENKESINVPKNLAKKDLNTELSIDDLFDMSGFFGESSKKQDRNNLKKDEKKVNRSTISNNTKETQIRREIEEISFSDFGDSHPDKQNNKKHTPEKDLNLDDFVDFSYFIDTPKKDSQIKNKIMDLTDKSRKSTTELKESSLEKKTQEPAKTSIIDLTDSDLESSPIKTKRSQTVPKTQTQLSITQMLSLISKTDENNTKLNSKKENTSNLKVQKSPGFSLSTKKGILQLKQTIESPKTIHTQKNANKDTTPKTKRSKFNISLAGDSDDEFETTCRSPIFVKPKPVPSQKKKNVEKSSSSKVPKKRKKLLFNEFIDAEAELSEDERVVVSEDEDSDEDCFEASFVADETQDFLNTTNMHAKYLQSVKSPARGKFKIPQKFRHNISNVYSQEVNNEDNTYVNDSFCVDTEDVESCANHDLSELEVLEIKLKEMKKNKKRKKSENGGNTKRRRIIVSSDDSD